MAKPAIAPLAHFVDGAGYRKPNVCRFLQSCRNQRDHRIFGHSMVVDPWGEALAEGDETEQVIRAQIDLALVDEVRSRIPVFEDRRPALY